MGNDRGGVIVGYFVKIAVTLAILAVIGFDAVSVGVAKMNVEDNAKATANAAAERWNETKNAGLALRSAVKFAEENGVEVDPKSFRIKPDGTVSLTVKKDATTLLLFRTKKTQGWTHTSATASAKAI